MNTITNTVLGKPHSFKVVINVLQVTVLRNCMTVCVSVLFICKWGGGLNYKQDNPNKNQIINLPDWLSRSNQNQY